MTAWCRGSLKSSPFHHHAWYGMCCFWFCASWTLKSWVCSNATLKHGSTVFKQTALAQLYLYGLPLGWICWDTHTWRFRPKLPKLLLYRGAPTHWWSNVYQRSMLFVLFTSTWLHVFKCALHILFCFKPTPNFESPVNLICMSLGWAPREDQHSHGTPSEKCVHANS